MKNIKITRKITQGVYVLSTVGGGCIVDALSQVSGTDNPLISVAVMKKNYTNELIKKNKKFAVSILGKEVNPNIIKTFGFNSMRDINKFEKVDFTEVLGLNIINDSLGYMVCEVEDIIENETHTLFIGKVVEADKFSDEEEMSYGYYQEHKEELLNATTSTGKVAWICSVCGYVYYGETLPEDFKCPVCGVSKEYFKRQD